MRHGTTASVHRARRLLAPVLVVCLAGCAALQNAKIPTESELSSIKAGMTRDEVLASVGPPTWTFKVRQEDLAIWNYRYNRNDCVIYQISMRPNGTVRDVGTGLDPACDHDRSSWH